MNECCPSHYAGHLWAGCCDKNDCGPCCSRCPTCPTIQKRPLALPRAKDPTYIWRDALMQPVWIGGMMMLHDDDEACDHLMSYTMQKMGAVYVERVIGWRTRPNGEGGWMPVSKLLARATPEGWVSM